MNNPTGMYFLSNDWEGCVRGGVREKQEGCDGSQTKHLTKD